MKLLSVVEKLFALQKNKKLSTLEGLSLITDLHRERQLIAEGFSKLFDIDSHHHLQEQLH